MSRRGDTWRDRKPRALGPLQAGLPPLIGGSMLLFKLTLDSLANRPLILHIKSAGKPPEAEIDLDV